MTAALIVGVIAVFGAVVARVTWRRPGDERQSVRSHQRALETLRVVTDRRSQSSAPDAEPTSAAPPRSQPSTRQSPRAGDPVRRTPGVRGQEGLVFVDAGASPDGRRSDVLPSLPSTRHVRRSARGVGVRSSPRRRSRDVALVGVGVVALAVAGAAVAGTFAHRVHHGTTGTHAVARPAKTAHAGTPRRTAATSTVPVLQPTTSTPATALYQAPPSYTVELRATGPCWVDATTAIGTVLWTGTLEPGQTQAVDATGNLVVRLGAAGDVTVSLDGEPVDLPPGFVSPFDMSFDSG